MCGIVGYIGPRQAVDYLLQGLRRLEYRGYDSAGIATIGPDGRFAICKTAGRIDTLEQRLAENATPGRVGIGHTRWATHGAPTDENAHPHLGGDFEVAIAHNGVIENFRQLKTRLEVEGYVFRSATDSEIIAHLLASSLQRVRESSPADGNGAANSLDQLIEAVAMALAQLQGTYGLAILVPQFPEVIIAARLGSPLVIGVGEGEHFIASDASPLVGFTDQIVYLADHQIAVITADSLRVIHRDQGHIKHNVRLLEMDGAQVELNGYSHFMLKEICEQPETLKTAMRGRLSLE